MAVQASATVPHHVSGDGHDWDEPHVVAVNDRDAFQIDVAPPHGQGLADADPGA